MNTPETFNIPVDFNYVVTGEEELARLEAIVEPVLGETMAQAVERFCRQALNVSRAVARQKHYKRFPEPKPRSGYD